MELKRPGSAELNREVATTADGRDITRPYVREIEQPQDELLRLQGGMDLRLYQALLSDDQCQTCLQQRRLALVSRQWEVKPGGSMRRDKVAAESINAMLQHVGWDKTTDQMHYGVWYGYSVAELIMARDGAELVIDRVAVRDRRRFRFTPERGLRMLTPQAPAYGEPMDERFFWTFAVGADHGDEPYGRGLAHWCYWLVYFKRNGLKHWLKFLEKFGQPTPVAKYPQGSTPPEIQKFLAAAQAMGTDSAVAIPAELVIEFMEAKRSGTADYDALLTRMDRAIAKVILGQSMTSEGAGGQYKGEMLHDVRQDLVRADADVLNESAMRNWVARLTHWNYPGAAVPTLRRVIEEPADTAKLAEVDSKLFLMGFRPTLAAVTERYGEGYEDRQPPKPDPEAKPKPTNLAAGDGDADVVNQLTDLLSTEAAAAEDAFVQRIRALVDQAESLPDLADKLNALQGDLQPDTLGALMQRALAVADLAGRSDVLDA